jgi:diguanylate cyclase (GGDEF)-like protein/PAS domain S-box-containing protein
MTDSLQTLERAYLREKAARERAEELLENKSRELYLAHEELQKSFKALKDKEAETSTILDTAADAILILNNEGKITLCNQSAERMFATPRNEIVVQNVSSFLQFEQNIQTNHLLVLLKWMKSNGIYELNAIKKTGEIFPIELSASSVHLTPGTFYILILRDITERKQLESLLTYQASHDPLTGLPNRSLLMDRLEQAIFIAERDKQQVAVIAFDLDHFKTINDSYGHDIGDILLKKITARIEPVIRKSDTFSRLGSNEYVLIMRSLKDEKDTLPILRKILSLLTKPFFIQGIEINTSASIGISLYPEGGKDPTTLLKNAEAAMHQAKEIGRNTFQFYNKSINKRLKERVEIEHFLQQALKKNEFFLHYQPIFDLANKKIVGLEALIRWQHPKLGLVPPQEFIPLAEETALILPIGDWVLQRSCEQLKEWQNAGFEDLFISINLSSNQLKRTAILQTIHNVCKKTGIHPSSIHIEITENVILEDVELAQKILTILKDLGINLIIDDFGTGYSSLTYLQKFPISAIKIDRSFISYLTYKTSEIAFVLSILAMAQKLNLKVIAEGVETKQQLEFLREHGCDMIQGFHFCYPLPANEVSEFLKKYRE